MKKILIFGGTQFVGKRLINNLLEKKYNITVVSRGNWPVPNINSVKHVIADRYDPKTFGTLTEQSWDVIVDQLAFYGYDAKVLVDAFKGKVKKIICVTSNAVYDAGLGLKENSFDPISMNQAIIDLKNYREPKVDTEEYQQGKREVEYVYTASGIPTTLVRFPIIVGPDDLSMRFYNLFKMIKNDNELKIENYNRKQSFISSRDAARFLSFCTDKEINGPINACLDGDFTLQIMEEFFGKKIRYAISQEPNSFLSGKDITLDNRFAKELGFVFDDLKNYIMELSLIYYCYNENL